MALIDTGLLILRIGLGVVFLYHGYPKLAHTANISKMMKWATPAVFILGLVEVLSALAVLIGFYAELGALLLSLVMIGALYHKLFVWKVPFSAMDKTGWELDLMLLASALLVTLGGAGTIALTTLF